MLGAVARRSMSQTAAVEALYLHGNGPEHAAVLMHTDAELIGAVLGGEREAFAALVRRYERAAWATAWRVLQDYHAAQDATQDSFVEVYRRLGQLRNSGQFGVWLLRITRRKALRIAARRRDLRPLGDAGAVTSGMSAGPLTPEGEDLAAALGRPPDHERVVVALRYLDGHPVGEVARLTGRPVGTVTKQLSRAVERLKSLLREVSP
jgi:RNA polymerase sigma-70 factor, ECF subfamily